MVDVCLVVEGTYPKLTGGVSQWVQDLTEGLGELEFAVAHLTHDERPELPAAYTPPANVAKVSELRMDPANPTDTARIEEAVPDAHAYHALATGFSGLLAARVAGARARPMVLTEHGLYWSQARQLGAVRCEYEGEMSAPDSSPSELRESHERWVAMLEGLARDAYAHASVITTVCGFNARRQRAAGAPDGSVRVVNNAVPLPEPAPVDARARERLAVGLVGRVCPIKDVASFVRSCAIVADQRADVDFVVIGPLDQDPSYAARCQQLAAELGLSDRLRFVGETDPGPWYGRLDVLVSTSVSEGQPLALLEAMASGVPVVASAVGGCPDLLRPLRAGGPPSGLLTPPGSPRRTAGAILALCGDPALRRTISAAGRRRVERLHDPRQMLSAYRQLYAQVLEPVT
jgi:glycosyltransferase involved in cell wall biosynthesis